MGTRAIWREQNEMTQAWRAALTSPWLLPGDHGHVTSPRWHSSFSTHTLLIKITRVPVTWRKNRAGNSPPGAEYARRKMKSILITGCNRGLGLGLVKHLIKVPQPPQHIFATCRDVNKARVRLAPEVTRKEHYAITGYVSQALLTNRCHRRFLLSLTKSTFRRNVTNNTLFHFSNERKEKRCAMRYTRTITHDWKKWKTRTNWRLLGLFTAICYTVATNARVLSLLYSDSCNSRFPDYARKRWRASHRGFRYRMSIKNRFRGMISMCNYINLKYSKNRCS